MIKNGCLESTRGRSPSFNNDCRSARSVDENGAPMLVTLNNPLISNQEPCLAGTLNGVTYYGVRASEMAEVSYEPLRPVLIQLNSEDFIPVNAVMQVLDFFEEHRFCGRCGNEMSASKSDRGRYCDLAGRRIPVFPCHRFNHREMTTARAPRFVDKGSPRCGFVETGESPVCRHREIGEMGCASNLHRSGQPKRPFNIR